MADAEPLRLEVTPEPPAVEVGRDFRAALLANPVVRSHFPNADLWLVGLDFLHKGEVDAEEDNLPFHAVLADLAGSVVVDARGSLWEPNRADARPSARHRLPNDEEHAWAANLVRRHLVAGGTDGAGGGGGDGGVELYRPVPPLASTQDEAGLIKRAVTVGVRQVGQGGAVTHRLFAVRSDDGEVVEVGEPSTDEGGADLAAAPTAGGAVVTDQTQARVQVFRGEEAVWDLIVVRPQASSGVNGSGVELRLVDYQGVRVLHRAHVPIVNVHYEAGDAFRNWLNEEAAFHAPVGGDDPVPGFRICASAPRTLEAGGDFRGVALHLDGDELVVVSELQAGWHRYVHEWRLHADGTIRPRLGFAATRNPRTHRPHTHHAYLRLDFDVVQPHANQVQEHNKPNLPGQLAPWHTIRWEVSRRRDAAHGREWRVRSVRSPHGYTVKPGPQDGFADAFGAGDLWVLAQHPDELDDGEGVTADPARARAAIDRFVNHELVEREDVVLWYGMHVPSSIAATEARIGPDLEAFMWRKVEKGTYVPLAPPPTLGPQDDDDEDEDEEDEDE